MSRNASDIVADILASRPSTSATAVPGVTPPAPEPAAPPEQPQLSQQEQQQVQEHERNVFDLSTDAGREAIERTPTLGNKYVDVAGLRRQHSKDILNRRLAQAGGPVDAATRERWYAEASEEAHRHVQGIIQRSNKSSSLFIDTDPEGKTKDIAEWGVLSPFVAWWQPYAHRTYRPDADGNEEFGTSYNRQGGWGWLTWVGQMSPTGMLSTAASAGQEIEEAEGIDGTDLPYLRVLADIWRGWGTEEHVDAIRRGEDMMTYAEDIGASTELNYFSPLAISMHAGRGIGTTAMSALGIGEDYEHRKKMWDTAAGAGVGLGLALFEPDLFSGSFRVGQGLWGQGAKLYNASRIRQAEYIGQGAHRLRDAIIPRTLDATAEQQMAALTDDLAYWKGIEASAEITQKTIDENVARIEELMTIAGKGEVQDLATLRPEDTMRAFERDIKLASELFAERPGGKVAFRGMVASQLADTLPQLWASKGVLEKARTAQGKRDEMKAALRAALNVGQDVPFDWRTAAKIDQSQATALAQAEWDTLAAEYSVLEDQWRFIEAYSELVKSLGFRDSVALGEEAKAALGADLASAFKAVEQARMQTLGAASAEEARQLDDALANAEAAMNKVLARVTEDMGNQAAAIINKVAQETRKAAKAKRRALEDLTDEMHVAQLAPDRRGARINKLRADHPVRQKYTRLSAKAAEAAGTALTDQQTAAKAEKAARAALREQEAVVKVALDEDVVAATNKLAETTREARALRQAKVANAQAFLDAEKVSYDKAYALASETRKAKVAELEAQLKKLVDEDAAKPAVRHTRTQLQIARAALREKNLGVSKDGIGEAKAQLKLAQAALTKDALKADQTILDAKRALEGAQEARKAWKADPRLADRKREATEALEALEAARKTSKGAKAKAKPGAVYEGVRLSKTIGDGGVELTQDSKLVTLLGDIRSQGKNSTREVVRGQHLYTILANSLSKIGDSYGVYANELRNMQTAGAMPTRTAAAIREAVDPIWRRGRLAENGTDYVFDIEDAEALWGVLTAGLNKEGGAQHAAKLLMGGDTRARFALTTLRRELDRAAAGPVTRYEGINPVTSLPPSEVAVPATALRSLVEHAAEVHQNLASRGSAIARAAERYDSTRDAYVSRIAKMGWDRRATVIVNRLARWAANLNEPARAVLGESNEYVTQVGKGMLDTVKLGQNEAADLFDLALKGVDAGKTLVNGSEPATASQLRLGLLTEYVDEVGGSGALSKSLDDLKTGRQSRHVFASGGMVGEKTPTLFEEAWAFAQGVTRGKGAKFKDKKFRGSNQREAPSATVDALARAWISGDVEDALFAQLQGMARQILTKPRDDSFSAAQALEEMRVHTGRILKGSIESDPARAMGFFTAGIISDATAWRATKSIGMRLAGIDDKTIKAAVDLADGSVSSVGPVFAEAAAALERIGVPINTRKLLGQAGETLEGGLFLVKNGAGEASVIPRQWLQALDEQLGEVTKQLDEHAASLSNEETNPLHIALDAWRRITRLWRASVTSGIFFHSPRYLTSMLASSHAQVFVEAGPAAATKGGLKQLSAVAQAAAGKIERFNPFRAAGSEGTKETRKGWGTISRELEAKYGPDKTLPGAVESLANESLSAFYDAAKVPDSTPVRMADGSYESMGTLRRWAQREGVLSTYASTDIYSKLRRRLSDYDDGIFAPGQELRLARRVAGDVQEGLKAARADVAEKGFLGSVSEAAGRAAQAGAGRAMKAGVDAVLRPGERRANAIADFADSIEQRQRVGLFLDMVVNRGKSPEEAGKLVREALYDWGHAMSPWEEATLGSFFLFYRYHKLAMRQAVRTVFFGGGGFGVESAGGRLRNMVLGYRGLQETAAAAANEEDQDYRQFVGSKIYPSWATSRSTPMIANVPMSYEDQDWAREERGRKYTHRAYALPSVAPLDSAGLLLGMMAGGARMALGNSDTTNAAMMAGQFLSGMVGPVYDRAMEAAVQDILGVSKTQYAAPPRLKESQKLMLQGAGAAARFVGMEQWAPPVFYEKATTRTRGDRAGVARTTQGWANFMNLMPVIGSEIPYWADPVIQAADRLSYRDPRVTTVMREMTYIARQWTGMGKEYMHDPIGNEKYRMEMLNKDMAAVAARTERRRYLPSDTGRGLRGQRED